MRNFLVKLIQFCTCRIQIKGVPRLIWWLRKFLQNSSNTYQMYKGLKMRIDHSTRFHWANVFHYGGYETVFILEKFLRKGDVYIDIGANYGYLSINAASLVGDAGLVIAVEPEPRVREMLAHNLWLNKANVSIEPSAISEVEGEISFNVAKEIGLSRLDNTSKSNHGLDLEERVTVPVTTLDSCVAKHCPESLVRLIKIDVEGHELNILKGASNIFKINTAIFILEVNHGALAESGLSFTDLWEFLNDKNYIVYKVNSHSADWFRFGRQPSFVKIIDPLQINGEYVDVIAVPNSLKFEFLD